MSDKSEYIVLKRSDLESKIRDGYVDENDEPIHGISREDVEFLLDEEIGELTAAVSEAVLPPMTRAFLQELLQTSSCQHVGRITDADIDHVVEDLLALADHEEDHS